MSALDAYLKRTKEWRVSQLLVSFIQPHMGVATFTISGWITKFLHEARIDTNLHLYCTFY